MLISYALIGATDYFDGKIARRLNQATELGKTLDSVADLFFYLSTAYFLYRLFPDVIMANFTLLMVFFGELALSFVISAIKCKKPLLMHTALLRFIFSFFFDTTLFTMIVIIIYMIAFLEEILIFIIFGEIDPDTRSIFDA
jgi:phosphatidylglycerophosphate synthase